MENDCQVLSLFELEFNLVQSSLNVKTMCRMSENGHHIHPVLIISMALHNSEVLGSMCMINAGPATLTLAVSTA
jgi:hypothetical protein